MRKPFSFLPIVPTPTDLPKIIRKLEFDMETVINVLKPGPLGIVEHKFSATELHEAKATVARAINNWRRNKDMEKSGHNSMQDIKKDPIANL